MKVANSRRSRCDERLDFLTCRCSWFAGEPRSENRCCRGGEGEPRFEVTAEGERHRVRAVESIAAPGRIDHR